MNFKINDEIFQRIQALRIGVLVLADVDNSRDISSFFDTQFAHIEKVITQKFDGVEIGEYPLVAGWREIYRGFGEKKARSSIEALIRRVAGGKGLYRINALVDIYNLASLQFELPCGGEDLDAMNADLELTVANGTEKFLPIGAVETENTNPGEIIYKSGDVVVCRNFNYRESDITKLTVDTRSAVIVFEDILGEGGRLESALEWMAKHAGELLGARVVRSAVLGKDNPELSIL
jgi:DNA/RNA-binding domain of Phe-tRNA-synthetase-like protein